MLYNQKLLTRNRYSDIYTKNSSTVNYIQIIPYVGSETTQCQTRSTPACACLSAGWILLRLPTEWYLWLICSCLYVQFTYINPNLYKIYISLGTFYIPFLLSEHIFHSIHLYTFLHNMRKIN